ncbi:neuraminidase-like domain-containing protein [Gordonia rhizosphera]|uniref:Uncharacterized protein n=1 Tax=Gordonia rhizosphera NBRC 16068 TaxID=1108045 RepID=K6W410_9ACTN|nr:neuraminidase-like domain-containing protein [Gordonia rhizosphera]GAB93890.1 hypothetical protein GORHZ_247_00280 [Gordonia rhizosphera NBRC 16068]
MNRVTSPVKLQMRGQKVADLQDALTVILGRQLLLRGDEAAGRELAEGLKPEREAKRYGRFTRGLVSVFQQERQLQPTGEVDEPTANALNNLLEELGGIGPAVTYHVEGRVVSRVSASVDGLRVVVVDKSVGGDVVLAEATTDVRGNYEVSFLDGELMRRGKQKPDLQARVFSGGHFLVASTVRYDVSTQVKDLNVLLDEKMSRSLRSEHETLIAALSVHYRGDLRDLQETDERQDVTYLANKTGWDARAVALGALADQFSARTTSAGADTRIEPAFFYALLRAGLPANDAALYRTDSKTVEGIWKQALEQGLIPTGLQTRFPAALEQFQQLASRHLMEAAPDVGASSFKEILELSLGDDARKQRQIADLYTRHTDDPSEFWEAVEGAVGEATARRLQLDGQLAYLTLNNAPLIRKLHAAVGANGLRDSSELVGQGFHGAQRWKEVVGSDPIPLEIRGEDADMKRERYAELLAAQVRLSFPTAVVAQMVKNGETPVGSARLKDAVHTFLTQHEGKFEIGMQPVAQYVARHNLQADVEVIQEITRIQRVYQISPGDEAMNGLLKKGIDSAHAVVRHERDEFVRAFKDDVGGEQNARQIHSKAKQVHAAVLNVALTFLTARNAPGIGVHSPASIVAPTPSPPANAADVLAYGTLESLFGEMDYCTCEHCRSILSPAAYLVDLLQFIDRPASEVPHGFTNPQTVLFDRRPDLQHLSLTCENTHTPLPYVDLVNETLEYYIASGLTLAGYEGYNTDDSVKAEELLASPQFVIDNAYTALAGEHFPPPLPFHQPLENLRRYFHRFETPLPEVMEVLRKDDGLERTSAADYGWRDIWMETLGLSRAEHRLLTEGWRTGRAADAMLTVKRLYGFDPARPDAEVLLGISDPGTDHERRLGLSYAKAFSRRVGVTYEELVEILMTRFVNPNSRLIPRLERLGVSFETLKALRDGTISEAGFDSLVAAGLNPAQYGGDIKAWVRNDDNFGQIMGLLTLTNPTDPEDVCSFDKVELRYSNPDTRVNRPRPFEFIRLIRFIRLWKKLGWTIEQTDRAIVALYPVTRTPDDANDAVNLERLDAGFLSLLPALGVVMRVMNILKLVPKRDLLPLLACFGPIDTHGESSLYRQMFFSPSRIDDAFAEDGYGNYLTNANEKLLDHTETLRGAFTLTASEFSEITAALGYDANTVLTLDNISAVFRRGWLARKLKLSVREFLLLTRFTGYDPFEGPNPVAPAVLRFIGFVRRLSALKLKPVQALYLIWNQDLSGKSMPAEAEVTGFARTLRSGLAAIEESFARVDDPDGTIARAHMALVYGNETTDLFFGLLENTFVTEVEYSHVDHAGKKQSTLEQPILDAAPGRIVYDDFRKRLSYSGVLTTTTREALKAVPGSAQAFKDAVGTLYDENQKVVGPFFARYPALLPLYDAFVASADPLEKRRTTLLEAFLPELKRLRKRQQALQSVSVAAEADIGLASALLEDAAALHAAGDAARPALDEFTAMETAGLAAQFSYAVTAAGNPDLSHNAEASLEYAPSGTTTLPPNATSPAAAISCVWSGYLEVPENGFYNVRIDTDTTAAVTLTLNREQKQISRAQNGGTWENTEPIELRAGALYAISLTVENVKNTVVVRWQTAGRGWEIIPARYLYSETLVANLRLAYVRFLKATALATVLKLTAAEVAHFAVDAAYHVGGEGWLNHLSVTGSPDNPTAAALLKAFAGLLDFSRMKADVSPGDERLLEVLRQPAAATADANGLLYVLTRWEKDSVDALLSRFGKVASDLAHVETLRRVYDAYGCVSKIGTPATALTNVTTNEPAAAAVRSFQASLRARYDESAWLEVLRPINDEMRSVQRDALVAYTLHRMRSNPASAHIDTPGKLFEYFLMDVQMDPCMLTSRIRHALSSVQLFIERCLMNLEPGVSPASIKAKQWEWMKRYRVWEANRKVFLWPENWLEPELRDDQSPFFKEAMSELLQGDITEDRAAEVLTRYLTKLEEVAKLEICGVHYEENGVGTADDVEHVIGRTAGANRKYFCRRHDGSWTPWEQISLDIEDNPVLPVVWKGRLFLFWLKLVEEIQQETPSPPTDANTLADVKPSEAFPNKAPMLVVKVILNWSEFLDGTWQPPRNSDPQELVTQACPKGGTFDRSQLKLSVRRIDDELRGINDGLRVYVSRGSYPHAQFFDLYNSFSNPEVWGSTYFFPNRSMDTATESLTITYYGKVVPEYAEELGSHSILSNSITDRTVDPHHPVSGKPWDSPFFYEDNRHVFHVTTDATLFTVPQWKGIGIVSKMSKPIPSKIPELVVPPGGVDLLNPTIHQPGFGVIDPSPVERFITEDAYINTAIGTPGTVTYGNKIIGPSGS